MSLTQTQNDALDELYTNGGDELAVQQKFNIKRHVWQKWLEDYYFTVEMNRRHDSLQRQADTMLAKFKPMALAVLMSLCQSQNEEISRKACVELLYLKSQGEQKTPLPQEQHEDISDETASKILAVLAEEKRE
ncbi:MAG: hypothetical protein LLF92_05375 [Planctomycetaceae bacterium]|nr:hypothetical protein [Planctomycetaceae bacterium]